MKELVLKKCLKCGAIIKIINDCHCKDCGIECCGEQMVIIKPNSVDAAFEKHIPNCEEIGDKLKVTVNHVMDPDHYIEWIAFIGEGKEEIVYLKPSEEARVIFPKMNGKIYAYCNKHGLWVKEV